MNAKTIEACARSAHEVNRACCAALGDASQVPHDDADFAAWARTDPDRLLAYLTAPDSPPTRVTFAAEAAGAIVDRARAVPVLLSLLRHADALVREGAIYGLASDAAPDVLAALQRIAAGDPSAGVRAAANDAVEAR